MQHVTKDILTTKEATKGSGVFDHELRALCTAMLKSLRTLRKFSGGPSLSKTGICSRQDAKNAKFGSCHFDRREKSFLVASDSLGMTGLSPSLCGPLDVAQDMLCAFARDIPSFGCGSAALGDSW